MNKVYRIVWNSALSAWVAVSEIASRRHASTSSLLSKPSASSLLAILLVGGGVALIAPFASATQANNTEIPLCTTSADCKMIVVAYDTGSNKASVNTSAKTTLLQLRSDGLGATSNNSYLAGNYGVAIGQYARAGLSAQAIGSNSNASTISNVIGSAATATQIASEVLGSGAYADGQGAISVGHMAYTGGHTAIAIGDVSTASARRAMAFGFSATASGERSIAMGAPTSQVAGSNQEITQVTDTNTKASGTDSIALGTSANASGSAATALGKSSVASGSNTIASGTSASASGEAAAAYGNASTSTGNGSVAVGNSASGTANGAIGIGSQAAASGTNSIATGYLAAASGSAATAVGTQSKASADTASAYGNTATASTARASAFGVKSTASGASALALGDSAAASGANSIASGTSAASSGISSIATGKSATASADYASAMGTSSLANATYANALGASSNATGAYSFAEGKDSKASGYSSMSIGNASSASDQQALAVGLSATASARRSIAIGAPSEESPASNSSSDSERIVKDATYATKATSPDALAIGSGAQATGQYSTALGAKAAASNKNTVAIGKNTIASGMSAVSIGYDAKGIGNYTVTIGEDSSARGDFGAAIGNYASAAGSQSVASGYKASASQANAVAVGTSSVAGGASSVAMGAAASATGESAIAIGGSSNSTGVNSTSVGSGSQSSGGNATALGRNSNSSGANSLASGYNANAGDDSAIAVGDSATASKQDSLAFGHGAQATESRSLAMGLNANSAETDSIAIGNNSVVSGDSAVALGKGAKSAASSGVALGEGASANRAGMSDTAEAFSGASVASTKGAVSVGSVDNERQIINVAGGTQDTDAVNVRQLKYVGSSLASSLGGGAAFDASSGTYTTPTFTNNNKSFNKVADALSDVNSGAVKYERGSDGAINKDKATLEGGANGTTLDNVANGAVSSSSKQAINGSQLYSTSNSVANALGGGSTVNSDGTVSNPSYTVHNADGSTTTQNTVGDAISNVDNRTADNTTSINNLNSGKTGLTQQAAAGEKITVGKDTDGTEVSFADKNNGTRKLTNVTDGTIASDSKDAVNGSQLYTEQTQRQTADTGLANALGGGSSVANDGTVTAPSYNLHNVDGSAATANNVGDALTNVDNRTVGNTEAINNINSGKTGLTQQAAAGEKITVGKDTDGTEVSFADKNNGTRKLTNVTDGTIASDSKDAVNGSQLYAGNQSIANALGGGSTLNPDGTVTKPTYSNNGTTYNNIGDALKDVNDGAVKYNRNSDGTIDKSTAALEGTNGTTLDNVAAGNIASDSKQAVNGSQLYTEQTQRQTADTGLANALGGGSSVANDGTVTAPTYNLHNADGSTTSASNVGDALTNVDNRTVGNTEAINNINSGKTGLTQQAAAGEKITVGKDTDGTEVSFADKDSKARTLSSVAAGKISSDSTEAVNGSQLYAGNQSLANALGGGSTLNPDGTVTKPTYSNNGTTYNNIGDALKDVNDGAVKYNRNSDGTIDKSTAALEGTNGTTLDNVAAGNIASDSKQAVNGSQLYTEQTQRQTADTGLANALGGGSSVANDGTVTAPTYNLHNADGSTTSASNVGDALTNVDNRTVGNTDAINNINSGKTGLTQQAAAGEKITVGKDTDGTEVSFADKNNGTRKLTNVTDGTIASDSKDAVNGSQLYAGNQSLANALGGGSTLNPDGTVTKPTYSNNGTTYNNIGDALKDVNDGAVKYNRNSDGTIDKSTAALEGTNGTTLDNVAAGNIASDSKQAVNGSQLYTEQTQRQTADTGLANALGGGSSVANDGTVTAPTYNLHNADGSAATANNVGDALTNVDNRTVGNTEAINNINSGKTGLTQQAAAGEKITVGKDTDGTEVSFADKNNGTRKLTNVTDGTIASDSKDAVNGSQLYTEQTQRQTADTGLANALGGGSSVANDGTVTAPTYNLHNADGSTTSASNVGDALTNVDNRTVGNTDAINNINSGKTGLTQQAAAGEKITVGKDTDGTEVSFADKNNGTRKLTNVTDGTIASNSKDAVNGSQLYTEQTQRQTADTGLANALGGGSSVANDGTVTAPTYNLHNADGSTTSASNVGDALTNVDNRTVGNTDAINNINSGKTGLTQQAAAGEKITVGKDTDGTEVSFADKDSKARTLSSVAAGKISSDSTEAVNGSQLYAGNQSLANALGGGSTLNPDGTVTKPTYSNNGTTYNNIGDALKDVNDGAVKYNRNSDGTIDKSTAALEGTNGTTLDNVAAGNIASDSKQAVNGSQLYTEQTQRQTADTGLANALGGGSSVANDGTVTAPTYNLHNADGSTTSASNVGDALTNVDNRTVGNTEAINNINSGKTGLTQQAAAGEKITVGKDTDGTEVSFADKNNGTRKLTNVTDGTIASDSKDAVNGSQLYAGNQSLANALGGGSTLNPDGTVTKPTYSNNGTTYNNIGDALKDVNDGAVKYNRNSDGTIDKSTAALEGTNGTTLDNVAAGNIASDSKQAVNGSQLYTEQTQRQTADTGLANALGGGSSVANDGTVTAPTYNLHNADGSTTSASNVGDALTNVDNRTVGNTDAINNINSGKTGLTQQAAAGEKITVGKDTDGTEVSFADKNNGTRKLTNVTDGTIASDSKDAVNGSQLYAGNQSLANALGGGSTLNPDGTVTKPTYSNNGTTYNNIGDALKDVNDGAVKYNRNSDGTIDKSTAALEGTNGTTLDNVAAGNIASDSKQAVNGSQLYTEQTQRQTADTGLANALGGGSSVANDGTVTAPTYNLHNADGSTTSASNVGDALTNVDNRTVGNTDAINNINSGKTGLTQQAAAGEKITVGKDTDGTEVSFADKNNGTRKLTNVTDGTIASDSKDAVNGSQLYAGNQSLANALGGGSTLNPDGTVIKPTYSNNGTTYNNIGDALKDVNDGAVKYNRNSDGTIDKSTAALEGTNGTTLDNVAAGNIASDSKQAVNGSQLYTEQTQRQTADTGLANALGGGSSVANDGTVTAPTYNLHNADGSTTSASNVGDALTNVDNRTVGNTDAINNINSGKTGLTQQAAAGEKITVGKDTDGTEVSFADKNNGTRKLTNVTDGTIASDSKDAVNGSQLYAGNQSLANALGGGSTLNPDGTVTKPTYSNNGTTYNNIGDALKDVNDGAVKYNRNSDGTIDKSTAALEGTNGTTLDNVAAGNIASDSKQAVNGSQLYTEQTQRQTADTGLANALGGGSSVANDGTVTAPTYNLHNADGSTTSASNVGDALTNVDNRTVGNTEAINNINSGKTGLTQQAAAGEKITVGKDTDGTEVSFADKDSKARTLSSVAAGKISSDSTEAVNGSQLYAGSQSIANALGGGSTLNSDGTVTAPTYHLHNYDQHSGEEPAVTYANVGDALANVDGRTITNTDQIREIAARVNPEGEYGYSVNGRNFDRVEDALRDIDAGAVKYDRNSDGTINTSKASLEGGDTGTVLDKVANGAVAADSKQAVNGSQLYATNQAINEINGGKTGLTQQAAPGEKITVGKDTDGTEVSFADKNSGTRKLTSVSDGNVSAASKDAVNGSQLYTEQTQRQSADTGLANALGGGAKVADDGSVTAPSYTLHNADGSITTANNVGGALTNLDDRTVNNTNAINQMASGKSGIVQQESSDAVITVGKDSGGSAVTFADKAGNARKLTNVANGDINSTSKDAVNGSQLYGSNLSIANALGGGSTVNTDGTLSVPVYTLNGKQYVGVDQALQGLGQGVASHSDSGNASATGEHSSATGAGSNASGSGSTANGDRAAATGNGSTANGANSVASNTNSTATGNGAKATGESATAIGAGASAGGKESTATGTNASAKGDYATASGVNSQASGTGSTASGHGAKASADSSSAFGKDAVASGTGSTASGNAATASGDGSTAYGQNATASGKQSAAFGQNATADGQNSVALGAGSSTDARDNTVSVGSAGNERTISNVADGTQASDAATVGQMSRGFSALGHQLDKVDRHAKAGTASAMAMTGLPQAVLPGRSMLSAGGGTYDGQSAVAVGLSTMTDNGRWIIKGQVSGNTQGNVGGAVGVGYQW